MWRVSASVAALAAVAAASTPAGAQLGPDAAACRGAGPALLVNVGGFKARTGNLRVNVYGSDPALFLAKGRYVRKLDLRVTRAGNMAVCVRLPSPGRYAVAVRHDVDGDGNDWGDGGGFSRNPRLSLTNLRPRYANVAFHVGAGVHPVNVILNYRFGLTIRPVRG
jgi:uncharacterized protein (DUF2141 family)